MALQKQPIDINFSAGLDQKTDPKHLSLGKFLSLQNSVFLKNGLLTKRNGFGPLTSLPDDTFIYVTTLNQGLVAIGNSLASYSEGSNQWINKGSLQLASLSTLPLVRSSTNQSYADSVVAANGLVCTAYIDIGSSTTYKYTIADSLTGQSVVNPTLIVPVAAGTVNSSPRVFLLGSYFIIAFGTSSNHIQYIAIPTSNPTMPIAAIDITSAYTSASTISWDGVVYSNHLYIAFNTTAGGQQVKLRSLSSTLGLSSTITIGSSQICTMMSLSADPTTGYIYMVYYDLGSQIAKIASIDTNLDAHLVPVTITPISTTTIKNITCMAENNIVNVYYELSAAYSWATASNTLRKVPITISGSGGVTATLGTDIDLVLGLGLASKAFTINSVDYMLSAFGSTTQPSYFLVNGSGKQVSRLAYSNGGGYRAIGLPSVTITNSIAQISYLIKDFIASANKLTPINAAITTSAVYSQTGVNLVSIDLDPDTITSASIGGSLNISGGMLWSYDGITPTEQGFNVFPDDLNLTTSTTGGSLADQVYYYQVTYEWADNNGNIIRSAPSIPITITTTGGSTSTNTLKVPTLRLTRKPNVKIVAYRWSTAQQVYYAIKSPAAAPTLNDTTVNSVTITDTLADASIIGNPILYTTGGVIENIPPPATDLISLFNNRLFMVSAEDKNLLLFSKQVIEATPVEMSDLLTIYVAPTTGAQGSTGDITAIAPMDDKLVVFKKDAIYYINGVGPDNTGANSQYSDATFISSVVGCANQNSIVFTPSGLIFQSDKGLWLLSRGLETQYIGAPVEDFTQASLVKTALSIPGTNQVRFTMDSGITLMYDYYFQQWGTFVNIPAISSTLYNSKHTYINSSGAIFQETPGLYLDNANPVLMSFTTGWGNLAGLQGYERLYFFFLLGQYLTPFKLNASIAYDYDENSKQSIIITPDNYSGPWGSDSVWGEGSVWGGESQVFKSRVFPKIQKCESFQLTIQEIFDPSLGTSAGAGLTLSGLSMIVGAKKGFRPQKASQSFG